MAIGSATLIFRIITFLLLLAPGGGDEIGIDIIESNMPQASLLAYEADDDGIQVDFVGPQMDGAFFTVWLENEAQLLFSFESVDGQSDMFSLDSEMTQLEAEEEFFNGDSIGIETEEGDYWMVYPGMAGIYLASEIMGTTFLMAQSSSW